MVRLVLTFHRPTRTTTSSSSSRRLMMNCFLRARAYYNLWCVVVVVQAGFPVLVAHVLSFVIWMECSRRSCCLYTILFPECVCVYLLVSKDIGYNSFWFKTTLPLFPLLLLRRCCCLHGMAGGIDFFLLVAINLANLRFEFELYFIVVESGRKI